MVEEAWTIKHGSKRELTVAATADPLDVTVKNGRLEIRSKFFSVRTCALWNAVPAAIKQLQPAHRFKAAYKQFRETTV